jgi:TrmH family RNA methyltransferase
VITSIHNPRIKAAARLRDGRVRRRENRFLIDGPRETLRALESGIGIHEIFVCAELSDTSALRTLVAASARTSPTPEILQVAPPVYGKIAYGERNDGIVAVATPPSRALGDLSLPALPLVGVLAGIEKPGNLGAVLRSADGAGLSALIAASAATDLYNPHVIRASAGAIFSLPSCATDEAAALAWLRGKKLVIYAAWVSAENEYTAADFTLPCAIVLGSEADGLGPLWRENQFESPFHSSGGTKLPGEDIPRKIAPEEVHAEAQSEGQIAPAETLLKTRSIGKLLQPAAGQIVPIRLPMRGIADSLNVSTAAAILFYEALRQRGQYGSRT